LRDRKTNDPATVSLFAFHRDVVVAEPRLTDRGFVAALRWLSEVQPSRARSGTLVSSLAGDEAVLGLGILADLAALKPEANKGRYVVAPIPAGPAGERVPYAGPGGALMAVAKSA